jgi:hypothetical protein
LPRLFDWCAEESVNLSPDSNVGKFEDAKIMEEIRYDSPWNDSENDGSDNDMMSDADSLQQEQADILTVGRATDQLGFGASSANLHENTDTTERGSVLTTVMPRVFTVPVPANIDRPLLEWPAADDEMVIAGEVVSPAGQPGCSRQDLQEYGASYTNADDEAGEFDYLFQIVAHGYSRTKGSCESRSSEHNT